MKLRHALRLTEILDRFQGTGLGARTKGCAYVSNLIKRATRSQIKLAAEVADVTTTRNLLCGWASVDELLTEQQTLSYRGLRKELRRFGKRQKSRQIPTVIRVAGGVVVWDGNHRCNAAIILGRKRIRVRYVTQPRAIRA